MQVIERAARLMACTAVLLSSCLFAASSSLGREPSKVPATPGKQLPAPSAAVESAVAKAAFWDLAVDHFFIAGQNFAFPNDFDQAKIITVKVGESVTCLCYYKVRTIPVGDITRADARQWGAGNLTYTIAGGLYFPGPPSKQLYETAVRTLPAFTTEQVSAWESQMGAGERKEWLELLIYHWTATAEHVGQDLYLHFDADSFFKIKETDEQNNGSFGATGVVAKFVVEPPSFKPGHVPAKTRQLK